MHPPIGEYTNGELSPLTEIALSSKRDLLFADLDKFFTHIEETIAQNLLYRETCRDSLKLILQTLDSAVTKGELKLKKGIDETKYNALQAEFSEKMLLCIKIMECDAQRTNSFLTNARSKATEAKQEGSLVGGLLLSISAIFPFGHREKTVCREGTSEAAEVVRAASAWFAAFEDPNQAKEMVQPELDKFLISIKPIPFLKKTGGFKWRDADNKNLYNLGEIFKKIVADHSLSIKMLDNEKTLRSIIVE